MLTARHRQDQSQGHHQDQNQEANDVAKNSAERLNVDMVHYFAGVQNQIDAKNYVVMLEETADSFALLLKMDVKLAAESKDVTSQNQSLQNQSIKKDAVVAWQEKCVVALAQFTAVYVLNQHRNQEFVVKH